MNHIIRNIKNIRNVSTYKSVIHNRDKYLSPSLKTFTAYQKPVVLTSGMKTTLWDEDGTSYIDLLGQNLCISVGYSHPRITEAVVKQVSNLAHCTTMYHHESSANLAKDIVQRMPPHPSGEDWVVHFVNDGSEAVDLAVQMARVYTGRQEIYGLQKAYHGLHGYAAGLTAIGKATQPSYSAMFNSITHVESNNLDQLENSLKYTTGGKVAGMIMEPLQGYGGIFPLDKDYMKNAFDLIHQYGGVTIADEVQTGYNRCGQSFWGFEMENNDVIPDIVTIAKGMGNGTGIIGAVICKRSIAEAFSTKMFFNTYGGNPMSCQVAREVLSIMDDEDILGNCKDQGNLFKKRLTELCEKYPEIYKEARGEGLFQGLEINGKDSDQKLHNAIELHNMLFDRGIIIGRGSAMGNVFRVQPPMCISTQSVEYVCDMLDEVANRYTK